VHATDPEVRHALLGRPRVRRELLPVMERLAKAGIAMHAQIVLCPGYNDGAHLDRTVHELARLHPAVPTTAVVPVGLTRHRERLPDLRAVTAAEAAALVRTIEGWQRRFRATLGTRFVWAADELYLQAAIPLPAAPAYEGFPVAEDGIGLVRRFEDAFVRAAGRRRPRPARPRRVTVVTGEMFAPRMRALLNRLSDDDLTVGLVPVANEFFGRGIGVAGLLTGRDIRIQLDRARAAGHDLGEEVLVPAAALRDGAGVFLDDLTPADLAASLEVAVTPVEPDAPAFLAALVGR
jgi:putative radical SAM enzyme (TIGR03279 family)